MRAIVAYIGFALVLIFSGCASLSVNTKNTSQPDTNQPDTKSSIADYIITNQFDEQWNIIVEEFIRPIPNTLEEKRSCFEKILAKGLSHCLNDTHSGYFSKEEYASFQEQARGSFGGIGLRFKNVEKQVIIEELLDGPAKQSDMFKRGDLITEVDGEDVTDISTTAIINKIRGIIGTDVRIGIERDGIKQEPVILTRATIIVPSVTAQDLDDNITHIRINEFIANTAKQFLKEVTDRLMVDVSDERQILDPTLRKFIYDIRRNPGGLLYSVAEIARFFSNDPDHIIVTQQVRDEDLVIRVGRMISPDVAGILHDVQAVILFNNDSASAAEIFAAFVHEATGAPRVGKQTYGKGSVQVFFPLTVIDGSALKLTVAKYFVGNKKIAIDKIGIKPEYEVDDPVDPEHDPQLQKAIELLTITK